MSHPQPLKEDKEDDPSFFGTLAPAHVHGKGWKEHKKEEKKVPEQSR